MSDAETFVHRSRGGCYASIALALIVPAMFVFALVDSALGVPQGPIPALVLALVALVFYFGIGDERRVVLDASGMRLARTTIVLGVRRPEQIAWALSTAELTSAREVTRRTKSQSGGWNTGVTLHLPGGHVIVDTELGGKGIPSSAYTALVQSLERRLGAAFTFEQAH